MEKLSRTKKYEDLRNSFTNDNEANTSTSALDDYQQRLNNILYRPDENRQNSYNQGYSQQAYAQPQQSFDYASRPVYQQDYNYNQPQQPYPQQQVNYGYNQQINPYNQDPVYNQVPDYNQMPSYNQAPVNVEPAYQVPEQNFAEPSYIPPQREKQQTLDDILNSFNIPDVPKQAPVEPTYVQPAPVVERPVETINPQPFVQPQNINPQPTYIQPEPVQQTFVQPEAPAFNAAFVNVEQVENKPVESVPAFNDHNFINDALNEVKTASSVESVPAFNDHQFINDALNEAKNYNKQEGRPTLDDISSNIIEDVRNNNNVVDEMKEEVVETIPSAIEVEKPEEKIEEVDTIDNTADSIQDVIDSLNNSLADEPIIPEEIVNETADDDKPFVAVPVIEDTINDHPVAVLAQTKEEIDIPTLTELQINDDNTMGGTTIPFAIENKDNPELDEEEDEELDTPSKVLNVLLTILVVALIAVLGFVVFELFKAGIIKFN